MTLTELSVFLSEKSNKLTLSELKQALVDLSNDASKRANDILYNFNMSTMTEEKMRLRINRNQFYLGEENAFKIVLKLLERVDDSKSSTKEQDCLSLSDMMLLALALLYS